MLGAHLSRIVARD